MSSIPRDPKSSSVPGSSNEPVKESEEPEEGSPLVSTEPSSSRVRSFVLLLIGEFVSFVGTGLTAFGIGVRIFQDTGSVTDFAFVALATILPLIFLSPVAGLLADRFDRRRLLIVANLGSGACSGGLFTLAYSDLLEPLYAYGLIALSSCFASLVWPTMSAATTLLVPKRHFARASGVMQSSAAISEIVAPALAGMLLTRGGLTAILLIDAGTFLFAATTLLMVRIPRPPASEESRTEGTGWRRLLTGWRFLRKHPGLLHLLGLFTAVNFCIGFVQVLVTPLVLSFTNPQVLGVILSVAGSGLLAGGVFMSLWGGPKRKVPVVLMVMTFQGMLLFLGGVRPSAILIGGAAFLFLLGVPVVNASSQAIWQSKVPPDVQGRVFALRRMLAGAGLPLSLLIAGPLADHVFEPLLAEGGALSSTVGQLIGTGPGRGIGLMFVLVGVLLLLVVWVAGRASSLRRLEEDVPDVV